MKTILTFIFLCLVSSELFPQVPIQYYDFENNSARATTIELTPEIIINSVSGSTVTSTSSLSQTSGNPSSGSGISRANWQINATDPGTSASEYIQFSVNSDGFSGLKISIDILSVTASVNFGLLYSSTGSGGTFTEASNTFSPSVSYGTISWDLSGIALLDNNANVVIRIYGWGTTGPLGSCSLDNLYVYANTVTSSKSLGNYQLIDDANGSAPFPTFTNFTVNGSGITAALSSNLHIGGTLTLTNGILATGTNSVIIDSLASISGASSNSYIYGNLTHTFDYNTPTPTRSFPIGSSSVYSPIQITTAGQNTAGTISVKVTNSSPGSTSLPAGVSSISAVRYWTVTLGGGLTFDSSIGLYAVKLFWGADDGVIDTSKVTVVRGTAGGAWTEANNNSSSNINKWVNGSFSSPLTNDFTFGDSTGGVNALPVEIYSLSSEIVDERNVLLKWSTATEVNSYGFEVERLNPPLNPLQGGEGKTWGKIGFVEGHGNSNSTKSYSYQDKNLEPGDYQYRLKTIDVNGSFSYSSSTFVKISAPVKFVLSQNYPNPFNPATVIKYSIPAAGLVTLDVFNVLGQKVAALVNEVKAAGEYSVNFDASSLASGIYVYRIISGNYVKTMKMALLK